MDTINLNLFTHKEIPYEELLDLENNNPWIKKFRRKATINNEPYSYSIGISFSHKFYFSNAYLITKQEEVNEVLSSLYELIKNYGISSCILVRVDYPFTYLMPQDRNFNSYSFLFKAIAVHLKNSEAGKIKNWKTYSNTATDEKQSFIFTDTLNTQKYNNKIIVYNQNLWKYERDSEYNVSYYKETLDLFPDLPKRMRIEISRKTKRNIFKDDCLFINLQEEKESSFNFLQETIFNVDELIKFSENSFKILNEIYMECKKVKTDWKLFYNKINQYPNLVYDKEIIKKFVNELELSKRGKEKSLQKLRGYGATILDSKNGINIIADLLDIVCYLKNDL